MLNMLLMVIVALAFAHAVRIGCYRVRWGIDPVRALTLLFAVLIMMAFAIGFIDF